MTKEKWLDAISDLDADILDRYFTTKAALAEKKKSKNKKWMKWGAIAACLIIVSVLSLILIQALFKDGNTPIGPSNNSVISPLDQYHYDLVNIPYAILQIETVTDETVRLTQTTNPTLEDYTKMEYRIPEELGTIIEEYITATESVYNPSIDTLFCKSSQFSLLNINQKSDGYYGYPNLLQCLNHFYNDILIGQFGLTVVEGCDFLSSPKEIERIHLGDTRHIAMVSLMLSGGSPSVCRALADHHGIDISSNYYTNIESFLKATSREGYRPSRRNSSSDKNGTAENALCIIDRTMKINGGYCQSKLAQSGNFCDCACAVSTEGGFGDCCVCHHFIPVGTSLPEYTEASSKEMKATCVLLKQSIESIRQGNGSADTLSEVLDRLHAQALKYCHLSALTRLIKETEES